MRRLIQDDAELLREAQSWFNQPFAFDVETSGLSFRTDELLGVALYFEDKRAYYLPLSHTMPTWDGNHYREQFLSGDVLSRTLIPLFLQDVVMVGHNLKFDRHHLKNHNVDVRGRLFDTLLATQLLDENRPRKDLKALSVEVGLDYDKYQELIEYKGFKKDEILGVPLDKVAQYAMNDVEASWKLYQKFRQELAEKQLENTFYDIWMPLNNVLFEMEQKGIRLNRSQIEQVLEEYEATEKDLRAKVERLGLQMLVERYERGEEIAKLFVRIVREDIIQENDAQVVYVNGIRLPVFYPSERSMPRTLTFNVGSSDQLFELVYNYSGVSIPKYFKLKISDSGRYSVDKDNLETLIFFGKENSPEVLRQILEWRKASKFITTYLHRFLEELERFESLTTNFNQARTKTGRLASSQPNLNRGALYK